jgi:hypothetical protein
MPPSPASVRLLQYPAKAAALLRRILARVDARELSVDDQDAVASRESYESWRASALSCFGLRRIGCDSRGGGM